MSIDDVVTAEQLPKRDPTTAKSQLHLVKPPKKTIYVSDRPKVKLGGPSVPVSSDVLWAGVYTTIAGIAYASLKDSEHVIDEHAWIIPAVLGTYHTIKAMYKTFVKK